ncbi:hypothetical protein COCON_G00211100 [Conger conger]|uniref:Uncharacterized protein n=1 Tax=Conger conger TaxID=82655 RepID=A0A9Q1HQF3_CONCO|nr:hypothetical protein COCON_G00211100 [Conger conger]
MGVPRGWLSAPRWPLLVQLLCSAPWCLGRPFGPAAPAPTVNVAVVFSGSAYQTEIKGRLSRENFLDLPLEVNPITVLVNNTNPRTLLTRICDTLAASRVQGVVFEDNVGSEAVAQMLDFISAQTGVPIVGISGGPPWCCRTRAAVIMKRRPPKAEVVNRAAGRRWSDRALHGFSAD